MSWSLRQSRYLGGVYSSPATSVTSPSNEGFSTTTLANSFLVAVCSGSSYNGGTPGSLAVSSPNTPGFAWTYVGTAYCQNGNNNFGVAAVYIIPSASAMATTVYTQCTTTGVGSDAVTAGVTLWEFTGASEFVGVTNLAIVNNQLGGNPQTANLTTLGTDLILVQAPTSTNLFSAGPNFTVGAGPSGTGPTGYSQYELNAAAGSVPTGFASSTNEAFWGIIAIAFGQMAPTALSCTSSSGPFTGGQSVTITGTNFSSGATVKIGSNAATDVVVVNDTTMTCTTPAGTGTVDVSVTISTSGTGTLTAGYTYIALSVAPTSLTTINKVWGFSPALGDASDNPMQGQIVTVTTNAGSWTATANESWVNINVLSSTTFSVSVTSPNNSGANSRVLTGSYAATITVTAGPDTVTIPVNALFGYGDSWDGGPFGVGGWISTI